MPVSERKVRCLLAARGQYRKFVCGTLKWNQFLS